MQARGVGVHAVAGGGAGGADGTARRRGRRPHVVDGGALELKGQGLARVEQVKEFRLIQELLTAEDEELTPTMKLKRSFVHEKYRDMIETMYSDA